MTPLIAHLSQALVAFTIEFDNEFEHRMPHRTTRHGGSSGPWLVSMAMFLNCMKFVGEDGLSPRELEALAGTTTNLHGMRRWRYIDVGADRLIRATRKGRLAQEIWRPLFCVIEGRWRDRFGSGAVDGLVESLRAANGGMTSLLPDCLPILGYGLWSTVGDRREAPQGDVPLATLLSQVLLQFALEFERESEVSLAIAANPLRVLDETGVRVRDLPLLTGVSKEAIQMALGILTKKNLVSVVSEKGVKVARLTPHGARTQAENRKSIAAIETRRRTPGLRESLERILDHPAFPIGLEPYPDNWRASVRKPRTLPHYPMVLHRGGFPDGS